jgi:hypothetical protein
MNFCKIGSIKSEAYNVEFPPGDSRGPEAAPKNLSVFESLS